MSDAGFPERAAGLKRILESGIEWMQRLKDALIDERDALERRDAGQLAGAALCKEQLAEKLRTVDRHRSEIRSLAEAAPDSRDPALRERLQAFREISRDCERLNRTNGTVIRSRHRQVVEGLAVLHGRNRDEDTYTLTGRPEVSVGRRALTEV